MLAGFYWDYLCCNSLIPVRERTPKEEGRFPAKDNTMHWRDWDGCPRCEADVPLIAGRKFAITSNELRKRV